MSVNTSFSMDHLAIMRKSWGLTNKILTREKQMESRWYKNKYPPWNNIKPGETVYFKDSGDPVTIKAEVERVIQISDLSTEKVNEILKKYGTMDGISKDNFDFFFELFKDKKYCILIFLKTPERIKPFNIDKKGFGVMSSWIKVNSIEDIKL